MDKLNLKFIVINKINKLNTSIFNNIHVFIITFVCCNGV